ncbi:MAG: amino acid permease [Cyclobacteriaceae bacterium]|nr:amino acid permease [Cyclobacteriaceae bacterium]
MKKLERRLNLTSVIAISIGGMLGSGIFVLPGLAAAKTGPSIWIAYLLAGICVLPAVLSKSELATAMPTSGGTYVYIERTFGPIFGTIAGFGLWLSLLLKSAFALVGFGAYLFVLAQLPLKATSLGFLFLIMILNVVGVKKVGQVQIAVVSLSLVSLLLVMVFGLPSVESANLEPFVTEGGWGLLSATAFVFISYAGVTKIAAVAEEIKNPGRNLPLAMILALILITIIYSLITFTLVGNIQLSDLSVDIRPIYSLALHLGGEVAGYAAAVVGVVTLTSMANSGVLAGSRFPFAMSRDKLLPSFLSSVHPKYTTPVVTIVLTCSLMALAIIFLDVERIAKLASAFMVMMFIAVNSSVIVLRETSVQWYAPSYRSPWYPFVQIFGIVSGLVLLFFLGYLALIGMIVIVVGGVTVYYFYGSSRVQRSGVLKVYGHRPAFLLYNRRHRENTGKVTTPPLTQNGNLDGGISSEAHVVVPLLGNERSSEILVEMGAAIAPQQKVQVVHLKEVPDQTILDALLVDDVTVTSLNRRVAAMASENEINVDFDAAVTHDLVETIFTISNQTHCRWVVMSWDGRANFGLLIRNPIGWLVTKINSNFALFKDKGVRYIRKILVAKRPGREDHEFMAMCGNIARFYKSSVTLVRVVDPQESKEVREAIAAQSASMASAYDFPMECQLLEGRDPVKTIVRETAGYDLLITGTPQSGDWRNILLGAGRDKFADQAACSVLRLTFGPHTPN